MVEGGRAIARGLLQGAMGIITKPVEGAEQGGVAGFFEGLAKVRLGGACAGLKVVGADCR